jgi:hypothetical protein
MAVNRESADFSIVLLQENVNPREEKAEKQNILAQRAKLTHNYKNSKLKLLKCNASIWFNKQCKVNNLTPISTRKYNTRHT